MRDGLPESTPNALPAGIAPADTAGNPQAHDRVAGSGWSGSVVGDAMDEMLGDLIPCGELSITTGTEPDGGIEVVGVRSSSG